MELIGPLAEELGRMRRKEMLEEAALERLVRTSAHRATRGRAVALGALAPLLWLVVILLAALATLP